jgi:AbrB family looped-hinge helix DNA binding protein
MNATITIDKAGRIVLPKPVRDELQLEAGASLELEISGREITLRPVRPKIHLRRENGLLVYSVGEPLTESVVEETIDKIRRERDEQNLGKTK